MLGSFSTNEHRGKMSELIAFVRPDFKIIETRRVEVNIIGNARD